jgi:hypothetical protein
LNLDASTAAAMHGEDDAWKLDAVASDAAKNSLPAFDLRPPRSKRIDTCGLSIFDWPAIGESETMTAIAVRLLRPELNPSYSGFRFRTEGRDAQDRRLSHTDFCSHSVGCNGVGANL